ncbi:30S ribosomal protein S6 [Propionicimonas sp.]|uniref:30S ribosomal protein S6 n=1 Tax=Propionicimonas sp. TaxID=1955623 RepID=UPI003D0D38F6
MRAYEVMVILDPSLEERTVAPSLDTYLNVVRRTAAGRERRRVGQRRLAYEINKNAEGIYAVDHVQAEPATVKELDRQLTLNESVCAPRSSGPTRIDQGQLILDAAPIRSPAPRLCG